MQKKIKQHDENDCGAACLAEMARLFGYDMSVAVARDYVKTDRNGTTLYGITRGAEKIGIDAQVLHGSKEELEESLKDETFFINVHKFAIQLITFLFIHLWHILIGIINTKFYIFFTS